MKLELFLFNYHSEARQSYNMIVQIVVGDWVFPNYQYSFKKTQGIRLVREGYLMQIEFFNELL